MSDKAIRYLKENFPLALVLMTSLGFSFTFFVGIGSSSSLTFSEDSLALLFEIKSVMISLLAGSSIVDSATPIINLIVSEKANLFLPMLLQGMLFQFIGLSEESLVLLPLFFYLGNIFLLFKLADKMFGKDEAFISSFIWALLPINSIQSTQLFTSTLPIFLLLYICNLAFNESNKKSIRSLVVGLVLAILLATINIWLGLASIVFTLWRKFSIPIRHLKYLTLLPFLLFFTSSMHFRKAFPLIFEIIRQPGYQDLFPLALLSYAVLIWTKQQYGESFIQFSVIAGVVAIVPNAMQVSGSMEIAILLSALLLSFVAAKHLQLFLDNHKNIKLYLLLFAWLVLEGGLLFHAFKRLIPMPDSAQNSIVYLLYLLEGFAFVLLLLSPLFLGNNNSKARYCVGSILLSLFLFIFLGFSALNSNPQAQKSRVARQIYQYFDQKGGSESISIVQDGRLRDHIEFLSLMNLEERLRIQIVDFEEISDLEHGYLLIGNEETVSLPENLRFLESIGLPGKEQVNVFRVVGRLNNEGADDYCLEIDIWLENIDRDGNDVSVLPVELKQLDTCFAQDEWEDKSNWLRVHYGARYLQLELSVAEEDEGVQLSISRKYVFNADPRIFAVEQELQSNAIYIYSISVKAKEPVTALYWGTKYGEGAFGGGKFSDWQTFSVLLATPNWESSEMIVLSPAIFNHYGEVLFREFYFELIENIK